MLIKQKNKGKQKNREKRKKLVKIRLKNKKKGEIRGDIKNGGLAVKHGEPPSSDPYQRAVSIGAESADGDSGLS